MKRVSVATGSSVEIQFKPPAKESMVISVNPDNRVRSASFSIVCGGCVVASSVVPLNPVVSAEAKTTRPEVRVPAGWMTQESALSSTGLGVSDLMRLKHHLEIQHNPDFDKPLFSCASIEKLKRLYKLPNRPFLPTLPDLSGEEAWTDPRRLDRLTDTEDEE